jgi:hypothetical protein
MRLEGLGKLKKKKKKKKRDLPACSIVYDEYGN